MDELIKFLTSKIGYTLTTILGFGLPGNLFIFVWNRNLYLEMDIIKLLILSFAISFMIFIPNLFLCTSICMALDAVKKEKTSLYQLLFLPIIFTVTEMILAMMIKIISPNYSIEMLLEEAISKFGGTYLSLIVVAMIFERIFVQIKKKISSKKTDH